MAIQRRSLPDDRYRGRYGIKQLTWSHTNPWFPFVPNVSLASAEFSIPDIRYGVILFFMLPSDATSSTMKFNLRLAWVWIRHSFLPGSSVLDSRPGQTLFFPLHGRIRNWMSMISLTCKHKWLELGFLTLTVVSAVFFLYLFNFWRGQGGTGGLLGDSRRFIQHLIWYDTRAIAPRSSHCFWHCIIDPIRRASSCHAPNTDLKVVWSPQCYCASLKIGSA